MCALIVEQKNARLFDSPEFLSTWLWLFECDSKEKYLTLKATMLFWCPCSSPPIVLENTSNVHTAGTKTHTDPSLSSPASQSTPHLEANTSHMLTEKVRSLDTVWTIFLSLPKEVSQLLFPHYLWQDPSSPVTTDTDSSVSCKDPEDIPTFDEWKRKVMEVEKEKSKI